MTSETASDTVDRSDTARRCAWPRDRTTPSRSSSVSTVEARSTASATATSSLASRRIRPRGASGDTANRADSSARTAVSISAGRSVSTAA